MDPQKISGCWFQTVLDSSYMHRRYLPLVDLQSATTILSSTARTTLTQTFHNTEESAVPEIIYTFPLYDGVSVVSFKCTVGERVLIGRVKERNQAKTDYQTAVDRGEKAGLLEMLPESADIFTTKVGNVEANQRIVVEIVYVGELKHDAETDSIRFTVPTRIAPRYGYLSALSQKNMFYTNPALNQGSMNFLVEIAVDSGAVIRGVQSPSHPIAVTLGRNSTHDEDIFHNNLASATLSAPGRPELEKDFVIMVNVKGQDAPRAMLETHPTLPGHRALMTTLVPKFNLPNASPEIVFVVDRSGSMEGKMDLVAQALMVFLKSLPTSVKFNICSFGSHYSFLFQKSRAYDQASLEEGLRHLQTLRADYGGTEMLHPIRQTVEQRLGGAPLEIMVLTDGQIFDEKALFDYINSIAEKQVRIFSLGIGSGASTSLVEGMARAGNGFAQFAQANEKIDKRIVRMLKATLTPFVHDYALEVKYAADEPSDTDDSFEIIESFTESMKEVVEEAAEQSKPAISLFDPEFNEGKTNDPAAGRYDHLPQVSEPKILQAPHNIPQLYAFQRTTIYLLFGPKSSQKRPQSVILKGRSVHGPLKLEIPVDDLGQGETIHQLAARKAVQDLEQGRGWITAAKTKDDKLLKDEYAADWERMVEREAVRLGTRFQVGGKHCSFVALEDNDHDNHDDDARTLYDGMSVESSRDESYNQPRRFNVAISSEKRKKKMALPRSFASSSLPPPPGAGGGGLLSKAASAIGGVFGSSQSTPVRKQLASRAAMPSRPSGGAENLTFIPDRDSGIPSGPVAFGAPASAAAYSSIARPPSAVDGHIARVSPNDSTGDIDEEDDEDMGFGLFDDGPYPAPPPAAAPVLTNARAATPKTDDDVMHAIIGLQEFDGSWAKVKDLLKLTGISTAQFQTELKAIRNEVVWATALALAWLEVKVGDEADVWDMVADKARSWIVSQDGFDDAESVVERARGAFFS